MGIKKALDLGALRVFTTAILVLLSAYTWTSIIVLLHTFIFLNWHYSVPLLPKFSFFFPCIFFIKLSKKVSKVDIIFQTFLEHLHYGLLQKYSLPIFLSLFHRLKLHCLLWPVLLHQL